MSAKHTLQRGEKLTYAGGWIFHNATAEAAALIMTEGMDQGSFADRPGDFGRDTWLAIQLSAAEPYRTHQYGDLLAIEPDWEVMDREAPGCDPAYKMRTIPPAAFVQVSKNAFVLRRCTYTDASNEMLQPLPQPSTPGAARGKG
jgi:hypothetical protein